MHIRPYLIVLLLLALLVPRASGERTPLIGQDYISFPTSTRSAAAQREFILGFAWLQSFGYNYALHRFNVAASLDKKFCMAYWGIAMANAHLVWSTGNLTAAQEALADLDAYCDFNATSARELAYIAGVRALWFRTSTGTYDVPFNATGYISQMESLVAAFPTDLEAKALLSVGYYGVILPEVRGFMIRSPSALARVRQLLSEVLEAQPANPGALHFWTHLNDAPEFAASALPRAHLYSRVAPDSSHAQHMQSHLRLRVGEFSKGASANVPWCDQHHDDTHNLEFLSYMHLQQGKWANALAEADIIGRQPDPLSRVQYLFMKTRALIDMGTEHECTSPVLDFNCTDSCNLPGDWLWYLQGVAGYVSVCGFAAARRGDTVTSSAAVARIYNVMNIALDTGLPTFAISANVSALQVQALVALHAGQVNQALHLLDIAVTVEDSVNPPAYGPPMDPIKCTNELYGEVLLQLGNFTEAIEQFSIANTFYPNRLRILLGIAESYAAAGNVTLARTYYQQLVEQLVDADYGNPILAMADEYLKKDRSAPGVHSLAK